MSTGSGAPLLLVHGGMNSAARWAPVIGSFGAGIEVTAMDRRGRASSGDSQEYSLEREYEDVCAVVELLAERHGVEVDVFGHSYGAVCALGAAARGAPIRRLALYEPPGPEAAPPEWAARATDLIRWGRPGPAMMSFLTEVVGLSHQQVMLLRDTPAAADVLPIVAHTLPREAAALATLDIAAIAREVSVPVMLLLGETSPAWAVSVTERIAAIIPRAEVVRLAGVGHEAIDTAPDQVTAALGRWLR